MDLHYNIAGINFCIKNNDGQLISENYKLFKSNIVPEFYIEHTRVLSSKESFYYDKVLGISISKNKEQKITILQKRETLEKLITIFANNLVTHADVNNASGIIDTFPDPLTMLISMIHFLRGKGIFLHAFAGIYKSNGFVFCGKSGAGKTTLARKWIDYGVEVLSDERIALTKENGNYKLYGTPWPGEMEIASNKSAQTKQIFILRESGDKFTKITSGAEFLKNLIPATYYLGWDIEFCEFVFSFLEDIFNSMPIYWVNRYLINSPEEFFKDLESFISQ